MNLGNDELGALKEFVRRQSKYLVTYEGTVLTTDNDDLNRGRIKVSIPQLGWFKESEVPWVEPEMGYGLAVPPKDAPVLVYFLNGSVDRPKYRGRTPEQKAGRLTLYSEPVHVVLFEDYGDGPFTVLYNREEKTLEVKLPDAYSYKLDATNKVVELSLGDAFSVKADAEGKKVDLKLGGKTSVSAEDGKLSVTVDKAKLSTDGSKWTLDADGNTIVLDGSKATVASNLEVSK